MSAGSIRLIQRAALALPFLVGSCVRQAPPRVASTSSYLPPECRFEYELRFDEGAPDAVQEAEQAIESPSHLQPGSPLRSGEWVYHVEARDLADGSALVPSYGWHIVGESEGVARIELNVGRDTTLAESPTIATDEQGRLVLAWRETGLQPKSRIALIEQGRLVSTETFPLEEEGRFTFHRHRTGWYVVFEARYGMRSFWSLTEDGSLDPIASLAEPRPSVFSSGPNGLAVAFVTGHQMRFVLLGPDGPFDAYVVDEDRAPAASLSPAELLPTQSGWWPPAPAQGYASTGITYPL